MGAPVAFVIYDRRGEQQTSLKAQKHTRARIQIMPNSAHLLNEKVLRKLSGDYFGNDDHNSLKLYTKAGGWIHIFSYYIINPLGFFAHGCWEKMINRKACGSIFWPNDSRKERDFWAQHGIAQLDRQVWMSLLLVSSLFNTSSKTLSCSDVITINIPTL